MPAKLIAADFIASSRLPPLTNVWVPLARGMTHLAAPVIAIAAKIENAAGDGTAKDSEKAAIRLSTKF